MKSLLAALLVLTLALGAPLLAQDKSMDETDESGHAEMPPPPAPLEGDWVDWMVGRWEGTTTNAMGTVKEVHNVELGLDGQFILFRVESKMADEMFTGMGAMTESPDGGFAGYWIDSFRTMAEGKGSMDGNAMKMVWTTPMGTYTRVTEKVDEDNFTVSAKMEMANGQAMEETGKFTRVKMTN